MSFLSALYTLIISPLELLFEVIFSFADRITNNEVLSIVILSLTVNILVLPLYKRADELQAEERDIQAKMAYRIKRTKQTFKGDERFMMLQEYYRINHYKPIYALKSSASLLLQIPFFIAAYRLLSGMPSLQGTAFGFISDLGKEDSMFTIGNFPVNILPILMTLINIASGIIYTKGQPLKSKVQVYGLAIVFLVLLYHSPSGLVFYWLLNNVFSLVKNAINKLKKPKKVLNIFLASAGVLLFIALLLKPDITIRQKILLGFGCALMTLPLLSGYIKNQKAHRDNSKALANRRSIFITGTVLMALLTGLLIPSNVVNASTVEFVDAINPTNPILYIFNSMLLSFGSWVLWGGIFYFFMNDAIKTVFSKIIWIICGISVVDYLLFGTKLGTISSTLQYDIDPVFTIPEYLVNLLALIFVSVLFGFLYFKIPKITNMLLIVGAASILFLGILNSAEILGTYNVYSNLINPSAEMPEIPLSKNGKNVVVLMVDRAVGEQVPYIINEKPELKEQFDGFTYYPNTISYGTRTIFGAPALFGGYEYTPERINKRSDESLASKHDEALKVMPVIFGNNGYTVTICDPSLAGYQWVPDLSIYDDYPDFHCYNTEGRFSLFDGDSNDSYSILLSERMHEIRNRNLFCYSLMKISPLFLQETLYNDGLYNESAPSTNNAEAVNYNLSLVQHLSGLSTGFGYDYDFVNSYPVLTNLTNITKIHDSSENTFLMMTNHTTHSPCLLQEPDYSPSLFVDNTAYDSDMSSRYTIDGMTMNMTDEYQITHYHVNMATFIQLGKWFDYLRENGVYDNTRIIIVSDHSVALDQFTTGFNDKEMEALFPLLLVKDFDATGFTVSNDFMTNGDTPAIATSGLIDNPVNPFTGNSINSDYKNGPQIVFLSSYWDTEYNNGNTFLPGSWYSIEGDPHDPDNWVYLGEG